MDKYKNWVCRSCGHLVVAEETPDPMRWTDGHTCFFIEEKEEESASNTK